MKQKLHFAMTLAVIMAMLVTSLALADDVANDIDTTVDATAESISLTAGGATRMVDMYIVPTGTGNNPDDGKQGCNLTGQTTLVVNVVSSNTNVATVSESTITFTNCETVGSNPTTAVTVSPVSAGSTTISLTLNSNNTGGSFNLAPATFTVNVKLAAPSGLTASGVSQTQINLNWTDNSTGEDNFVVEKSSSSSGTFLLLATLAAGTTSYSDTLPSCGETWYYRVRATKTTPTFNSDYSNVASGTTSSCAPPNTPPTVTVTGVANGSSYEFGSVPAAVCSVVDAEDGNSTFAATLSAITGPLSAYGLGSQTAFCSYTDIGGLSASASATYSIVDTTAPVITFVSRTPANANGWNNSDVTVNWSCTDNVGVVSASVSQTLSSEGANQSATGTCTDLVGLTASDTQTSINIDKTAPSVSASAAPAPNANGWNNTDVTVSFSGSDALSGIASCDAPVVLSGEGAGQSASGSCTDLAGNSASATASGINIDKTAPTASASASPGPNANGWNNTDVTVNFSGDDGTGSGIDFCTAPVTLSSEGAGQSASGTCTDKAGNSASATASNINIDKTAPTVALVGGPADGGSYYFGFVPAAPTCSASDALSGLDGSCSVSGYGTGLGSHTVTASATDKAGNSASASATYKVLAWTISGFYQPVDMGKLNIAKNGSTVPLKFEVFAGNTELTDVSFIKDTFVQKLTCGTGLATDDIENYATGGTSLRYDTTGGQFIFNWQTPKLAGNCYRVTLTTADGTPISAEFKLK